MFPKIRLVNGRAITAGSPAAGLRAALATGAERLVGTLKCVCAGCLNFYFSALGREGAPSSVGASPCLFGYYSVGCYQAHHGSG